MGGTASGATVALTGNGAQSNAGTGVDFVQQLGVSESTFGRRSDIATRAPVGQSGLNRQNWTDVTTAGESDSPMLAAIGSDARASLRAASTGGGPAIASGVNLNDLLGQTRGTANGRTDNTSYGVLSDSEAVVPDGTGTSNTLPTAVPLPASAAMGGSLFALMLTRRSRGA